MRRESADSLTAVVHLIQAIQPKIDAQSEAAQAATVREFTRSIQVGAAP